MLIELVVGYLAFSTATAVVYSIVEAIVDEINRATTAEELKKNGFSDSVAVAIDKCTNVITLSEVNNPNRKIKIKGNSISSEMKQGMTISGRR